MRAAPAIRDQGIVCPACNSPADPFRSGSVQYDRCRSCGGVWLDRGELEQIIAIAYRTGKEARLSRR